MKFWIYILIMIPLCAGSQVLDNRNGDAFTDKPFFNQGFIQENKVKSLKGTYVYMKKNEGLRETSFNYTYNFDNEGRLISTFETRTDDGTKDTTWNYYSYDVQNNLVDHKKTVEKGLNILTYEHDSLGRVISKKYIRSYRDTESAPMYHELLFNQERYVYFTYDHQLKRVHYNNYDLPYMDEYFNYNDLGYLVERIERIKMTSNLYTYSYEYNERGQLSAMRKRVNQDDGYIEEFEFKYDELGNLIEKHVYRNGKFTTDIQVIYNSRSKLLSSTITKQVSTGFMTILRFKNYEFYD